jgi:hypothetical protein
VRPSPSSSRPKDEDHLPPECLDAEMYVTKTRGYLELFDKHGGYLAEDVVGCIIVSLYVFRADYVPRDRSPTSDESGLALGAVFRDFWKHGRDLLERAGWWPRILVSDALGISFQRFVEWREGTYDRALGFGCAREETDRALRIRSIWVNFCTVHAKQAGVVDLKIMQGDVLKSLSEAGLRGADGLDAVPLKELRAEATLIGLAAEKKGEPLIYHDARGRARISWRAAKDVHPNRGQRMPLVRDRRSIGKLVHGRGANGIDATPSQDELNRDLLVQDAMRRDQEAATALQATRDEGVDREALLAGVRERVRKRGPAAQAALAYLLPIELGMGRKLSRREACMTVTPPVTPDALRHQETRLVPELKRIATALRSK